MYLPQPPRSPDLILSHLCSHLDEDLGEVSVHTSLLQHLTQQHGAAQGEQWSSVARGEHHLL